MKQPGKGSWRKIDVDERFLVGCKEAGFFSMEELELPPGQVLTPEMITGKKKRSKTAAKRPAATRTAESDDSAPEPKRARKQPAKKQQQQTAEDASEQDTPAASTEEQPETPEQPEQQQQQQKKKKKKAKKPAAERKKAAAAAAQTATAKAEVGAEAEQQQETAPAVPAVAAAAAAEGGEAEDKRDYSEWEAMALHSGVLEGLRHLGFFRPTPIQRAAIPAAITSCKDIVGAAETGSGKTLAFGVPIVHTLLQLRDRLGSNYGYADKPAEGAEDEDASMAPVIPEEAPASPDSSAQEEDKEGAEAEAEASGDEEEAEAEEGDESGEPPELEKTEDVDLGPMQRRKTYGRPMLALIITPTRELAFQVRDHLQALAKRTGLGVVAVVGGMSSEKQNRLLNGRPEIVVATPGRLWELITEAQNDHVSDLSRLRFLVLDEADRMVEAGHFRELDSIIGLVRSSSDDSVRKKRQTFVFSATLSMTQSDADARQRRRKRPLRTAHDDDNSKPFERLMDKIEFERKIQVIDLTTKALTVSNLKEYKAFTLSDDRDEFLYDFLKSHKGRTIVFTNSVSMVRRLVPLLRQLRVCVQRLHGGMQQRQRLKSIDHFRQHDSCVLVATDVAARGIDVPDVKYVFQYQVPPSTEVYIHRVGRTARAGGSGMSVTIVSPPEVHQWNDLCLALKKDVPSIFKEDEAMIAASKSLDRSRRRSAVRVARRLDVMLHRAAASKLRKKWLETIARSIAVDAEDYKPEDKTEEQETADDADVEREVAAALSGDESDDDDGGAAGRSERNRWEQTVRQLRTELEGLLQSLEGDGPVLRGLKISTPRANLSTADLDAAIEEARRAGKPAPLPPKGKRSKRRKF
eukprot:m51a1_g11795 putative atp-dependent rna helicase ddx24 (861) ;mRNA; f:317900-320757